MIFYALRSEGPSRCKCIKKSCVIAIIAYKHFLTRKLEKMFRKVLFSCTYNGAEMHVTCERFENAASGANDNFILTSRNYVC